MSDQTRVFQNRSEMNVIFVHSELDDRKLSTAEFRVYCHLARRAGNGTAFPGIDSMAKVCCLAKNTVIEAIKFLESCGMILTEKKPGMTTRYILTPRSEWAPLPNMSQSNHINLGNATVPNEVTERTKRSNATVPNGVTKGDPSKEIQKGNPSKEIDWTNLPENLDTPEFKAAWTDWEKYRRTEKKKPITETTRKLQFKAMSLIGFERAIIAINHTMEKGWQGIFEPKERAAMEAAASKKPDYSKRTF